MSIADVLSNRTSWHVEHVNALAGLRSLPDASVHCVVTSPPYFGLRDYGVAGQIGLESTPAEFVAVMVELFGEVRRVLHPTGVLWLNIGDSYSGAGYSRQDNTGGAKRGQGGKQRHTPAFNLGPKQLMMMPARVAIALQDDGWILRSDVIWAKPNPMPESVQDRPTRSHEYIYLFSKSERYYYDTLAIAEPLTRPEEATRATPARFGGALKFVEAQKQSRLHSGHEYVGTPTGTRNARTIWNIAPEPFPDAHFATFPTELPRRCVAAGSSEHGVCAACGAPWVRLVERETNWQERRANGATSGSMIIGHNASHGQGMSHDLGGSRSTFLGWQPSCACNAPTAPALVLDPFGGAGTTSLVARRLNRRALSFELNPDYCAMARRRIMQDAPLFNALEVPA